MTEREKFEAWISAPPYEYDTSRGSRFTEAGAWPWKYKDYQVELAWCAWQERAGVKEEK